MATIAGSIPGTTFTHCECDSHLVVLGCVCCGADEARESLLKPEKIFSPSKNFFRPKKTFFFFGGGAKIFFAPPPTFLFFFFFFLGAKIFFCTPLRTLGVAERGCYFSAILGLGSATPILFCCVCLKNTEFLRFTGFSRAGSQACLSRVPY